MKKKLVELIDWLMIKSVHVIIEILIYINYVLTVIFGWSLEDKYIADYITT